VDEIDRTQLQGLDREIAVGGRRADHQDRRGPRVIGEGAQHAEPVEVRHDEIEGHHVGLEELDLLQRVQPVPRVTHDLHVGIAAHHLAHDLAHERRVVDHQEADGRAHAGFR